MLSGATGMVGSFLVDVLMQRNCCCGQNCEVTVLGRSEAKARLRFESYWGDPLFHFLEWDIQKPLPTKAGQAVDYLFHLASTTHPKAYAEEPVDTVAVNVIGLNHLLSFACCHRTKRFVFTSSCEIYGECPQELDAFTEKSCGYIDCNTLRAGYPESKRAGEALCQAYRKQYGLDVVIPRLSRTFGPTMLRSDSKAISQFIKKGAAEEDVVLKSQGTQFYSYTYVADAVSGILTCLLCGKDGEAYNIASPSCNISLRELAEVIAEQAGRTVRFELPDEIESAGYSKATRSVLDSTKLRALGWKPGYDMYYGLERTIKILSETDPAGE